MKNTYIYIILAFVAVAVISSCANYSSLEPDEQLFTGLKKIEYTTEDKNAHFSSTQAEIEAALATAPNGALFGSSYYRTPIPYGLWIYNAFHDKKDFISKWLVKSFGNEPVVLSNVNPEMRISLAKSILQNNGYFRGNVDYDIIFGKPKTMKKDSVERPRTAKIAYKVNTGPLFYIDSISFRNFPEETKQFDLWSGTLIKKGTPFNISVLDSERTRIYNLLRNHGYFYYQQPYATYLADTLKTPGKIQLCLSLADSLSKETTMRWIIAKTNVNIQRQYQENITDSVNRRFLTIRFGGKRPPIRPRVILQDIKLYPGQLFSQEKYEESLSRMVSKGIFSSVNIDFTPRTLPDGSYQLASDTIKATRTGETRNGAGLLDMNVNCVLDKPYDFIVQANYLGKASGRMGPGASVGFAMRNAFRGGELLSVNISANYEFQTSKDNIAGNSYEISGDLTLTMPRLLVPNFIVGKRRRWQTTPQTLLSVSRETINRSSFFRRHILSGEMTYTFQPSIQSRHQFTPLMLEYDRLAEFSDKYADAIIDSPVLLSSLQDNFITKMRYAYTYTSPVNYRNPILFTINVTEASNILALSYLAAGRGWNEKDKRAFKTPFSQFVKLEMEWRKTWQIGLHSTLVAHALAGIGKAFGNSTYMPFSERFYIGGANNLRAFAARSIGPGSYHNDDPKYSYLTNVGDMKLVFNLEYRPRIFGSLYGAIFIDAGNIWNLQNNSDEYAGKEESISEDIGNLSAGSFNLKNLGNDLALGIGIGIRYDLDFFVIRLDWGLALHAPYATSRSGYFNMPSFKQAQCLNFAIGYPF